MNKKNLAKFLADEKHLYKQCSEGKFDACKDWRALMNEQGHDALKALQREVKRLEGLRNQLWINHGVMM